MALLVILHLGVEAVVQLPRALKPLDLPPRAPLDARTADSSPLIVLGAPGSGPSSSTPSYYDGTRRMDAARPDGYAGVRPSVTSALATAFHGHPRFSVEVGRLWASKGRILPLQQPRSTLVGPIPLT